MTLISLHHAYIRHSSILDHARVQRDGKAFLKECSPIHLFAKTWSLIHSPSRLGMATGRVWDGPPLPHFRPGYIFFFPFPSPNPGRGELVSPMPIYKRADNHIPVPNVFSGIMLLQNMSLWNFNKRYLGYHI